MRIHPCTMGRQYRPSSDCWESSLNRCPFQVNLGSAYKYMYIRWIKDSLCSTLKSLKRANIEYYIKRSTGTCILLKFYNFPFDCTFAYLCELNEIHKFWRLQASRNREFFISTFHPPPQKIEYTTKYNMFKVYWEWITKMNEPIKN